MAEIFSICGGIQPKMITSSAYHVASRMRNSRGWAVGLSNAHRKGPNLGSSLAAIHLQQLGRQISSHGIVGCSNLPPGGLSLVQGRAVGYGSSRAPIPHSSLSSRRVKTNSKLENDREEVVSSSQKKEDKKTSIGKKEEGLLESIEAELGRQFGGALWFSVLLVALAFFGGFYVFFIFSYADFSDIPILRGPQR